jgi:hypothetical protein
MNRGAVWEIAETIALINIWKDENIEGQLEGLHRNLPIFQRRVRQS